jgi:hypothetical protein
MINLTLCRMVEFAVVSSLTLSLLESKANSRGLEYLGGSLCSIHSTMRKSARLTTLALTTSPSKATVVFDGCGVSRKEN